jgi:hypothetical protein
MRQAIALFIAAVAAVLIAAACQPMPHQKTYWDYWPANRVYTVSGRVMSYNHQPVDGAKIVLVRQKSEYHGFAPNRPQGAEANELDKPGRREDLKVTGEHLVDVTSFGGEFSFEFEPWQAYDVWLYVDAEDQGFAGQFVQLNPRLRDNIMRGPGRNPIRVNIVLEPRQNLVKARGLGEDCGP